ncbi:MAG: acyltransferase [Halopseudomonas sp.]
MPKIAAATERSDWVDYAKAIGIILVVYGHVVRGLIKADLINNEQLYQTIDSVIYTFHMPLFFFLSGLFFQSSLSRRGGRRLIYSKLDTIIYPYILWSLLQGGAELIMSDFTNGNIQPSEVLSIWVPRAQFWFLFVLFITFIASTIYTLIFRELFNSFLLMTSAAAYLYHPDNLPTPLIQLCENLVFFSIGISFTRHNIPEKLNSTYSLLLMLLTFIGLQYVFHNILGKTYMDKGVDSLLLATLSIALVTSISTTIPSNSLGFLRTIGQFSMAIYLIHILSGSGARVILSKILGIDSEELHITAGLLSGILIPIIIAKLAQRHGINYLFSAPLSKWLTLPLKTPKNT